MPSHETSSDAKAMYRLMSMEQREYVRMGVLNGETPLTIFNAWPWPETPTTLGAVIECKERFCR